MGKSLDNEHGSELGCGSHGGGGCNSYVSSGSNYHAPSPSYHAPAPSYHAPAPVYHAPAPGI